MDDDEIRERYRHVGPVEIVNLPEIDEKRLKRGLQTGEWTLPIRWVRPPEPR